MMKVLIVDDEIEIVNGLVAMIPWGELGYDIVGTAQNGEKALELIRSTSVDILITDITMPSMNGLELIRHVRKIKKGIRTILLTCHCSFDYAKEAIVLEVDEYLVKHLLSREVLINTLDKLSNKISYEIENDNKVKLATHVLNQNRLIFVEKFFGEILNNPYRTREHIDNQAKQYNIQLPKDHYRIIAIKIFNLDLSLEECPIEDYDLIKFSLINIMNEILGEGHIHQYIGGQEGVSLYFLQWDRIERNKIEDKLIKKIEEFQTSIEYLKLTISVYITCNFYNIVELKKSIDHVNDMHLQNFYDCIPIFYDQDMKYPNILENSEYLPFRNMFLSNIRENNKVSVIHSLEFLFHYFETKRCHPLVVKKLIDDLMLELYVECNKQGMIIDNVLNNFNSLYGYKNYIRKLIHTYFNKIEESKEKPQRDDIARVITYIDSNIDDRITCEDMASMINMSRSYFSRLFKEELGVSFSDYVLSRKMAYAKDVLVHSNSTIQEVSEKVGFDTVSNFYRMFKKITGKTPKQIREEH